MRCPRTRKKNEGIEFGCDAGELEKKRKGSNLCAMLANPEQKEGIESRRDARKPESKQRDQIWAQFSSTRNKMKGSNLSAMLENPKRKEGSESPRNAIETE